MGNICSRSSTEDDPFAQPGRVLGAAPAGANASAPRAPLPAKTTWQTPGRTLGEGGASGTSSDTSDARMKAALAAQKRAESATPKGKLGSKLAAQKAQTHTQALNAASRDERAARDSDNAAEVRRWE